MIQAVTTCNAAGWELTGRRMATTFLEFWRDAELTVYAEGFVPDVDGVKVRRLPEWHDAFKERYGKVPDAHGNATATHNYRRDCIRFSHKVAAVTDMYAEDRLIWLDADTLTHAEVTEAWLKSLVQNPGYMAWLNRPGTYPECGFLMFNPRHPVHGLFMGEMRRIYESGKVFDLVETHDSFVFQHVAKQLVRSGQMPEPAKLSRPGFDRGHVFVNSRLSEKFDHFKGKRKLLGRTPREERDFRDNLTYWTEA